MEFAVTATESRAGTWLVHSRGELDLDTGPLFERELLSAIQAGAMRIVVDLTETTFIDSAALNALINARAQLQQANGERSQARDREICIVSSARNVTNVFTITSLDEVFPIYPTAEHALGAGNNLSV